MPCCCYNGLSMLQSLCPERGRALLFDLRLLSSRESSPIQIGLDFGFRSCRPQGSQIQEIHKIQLKSSPACKTCYAYIDIVLTFSDRQTREADTVHANSNEISRNIAWQAPAATAHPCACRAVADGIALHSTYIYQACRSMIENRS